MNLKIDRYSETWAAVSEHIAKRISDLHVDLETPTAHEATQHTRGRIAELRDLLALTERVAPLADSGADDHGVPV